MKPEEQTDWLRWNISREKRMLRKHGERPLREEPSKQPEKQQETDHADSSQRSAQLVRLQNMKIETLRLNKAQ